MIRRYKQVVKKFPTKNIIRITSDCPFSDINLIDKMIKYYEKEKLDYLSNNKPATFPDGLDVEIFKSNILNKLSMSAKNALHREHVTSHIKDLNKIKIDNYEYYKDLSNLRLTIDEPKDFELIKKILDIFSSKILRFKLKDIENLYKKKKIIFYKF